MGSRVAAVMNTPIYEDFEASSELVEEKDCDTIVLSLPGFRKEHLKVQLTSSKIIRISGSRPIGDNKWSRFLKEFPVSPFHDTQKITAKFENGILYIKLPKFIPPKDDPKMPTSSPIIKPPPSHKISSVQEQQPSQIPRNSKEEPKAGQKEDKKGDAAKKSSEEKSIAGDKREEDDIAKKLPRVEKTSNLDDDSKKKVDQKEDKKGDAAKKSSEEKSIAGDKREGDDIAKKLPREEKISNLDDDDSKKKVVAENKIEDDSAKKLPNNNKVTSNGEKREKEGIEGSGKRRVEMYKEREVDVGSKLRKDRRIFNLVMVVICALAIGLYMSSFISSFKRNDN